MMLLKLFLAFCRIGSFAIGGGYSFLPFIEQEIVEKYHWLAKEEFLDVLGVASVFPGAISVKFATYTGYKIAGIPGAMIANFGNMFTPAILIILASSFYAKYKNLPSVKGAFNAIQIAVFAMIMAVAFRLININQLLELKTLLIVVISFSLFMYTKIHPALIIVASGVIGFFFKL